MKQYIDLVQQILERGETRVERTGVGTRSIFGGRVEFDLRERFPLVTVKETRYKAAFLEMLWFLRGEMHTKYLHEHGCKLWDAWATDGDVVGPIYGVQWRRWAVDSSTDDIDQIKNLIDGIKSNPTSRRHIVTAWNPGELHLMGLPPCHRDFQCYVSNQGDLDLMVSQRSWDVALGAPFNIAQYALLAHLIARATGTTPRRLSFNYGDAHLYLNHIDPMREVIERPSLTAPEGDTPPKLIVMTDNTDIDGYAPEDFHVANYHYHQFYKLDVAV